MNSKRKMKDNEDGERVVAKRRALTLIQKVAILDRLAQGEGSTSVARSFGLNEGTVRSVKKCEDKIRSSVAAGTPHNAKMTFYARDTTLQKMEKILIDWINEQVAKETPIDGATIRKEAKRLYDDLKTEDESKSGVKPEKVTTFVASKGWYEKFKRRMSMYNTSAQEAEYVYNSLDPFNIANNEQTDDIHVFEDFPLDNNVKQDEESHLDHSEAKKFTSQLTKIIDMKKFLPQQVFNASESGLFWKKMPKETFLSEEENNTPGPRFSIDKLDILLCSNTSGDCFIKPMAVYRSANPTSLIGKNKNQLPVFWRYNQSSKITEYEFMDWFHNCFIHEVKVYLATKNIPFKVLLILDTLPCHPFTLQDEDPNVKVVFLPEHTVSLLQPFDQGLMSLFKTYYTRRLFSYIVDKKQINPFVTVSEIWWDFTLPESLKLIKESIEEIRPATINASWNKIWPDAAPDLSDLPDTQPIIEQIIELGHTIGGDGFKDLHAVEIEELLKSHQENLTNAEISELATTNDEEDSAEVRGAALKSQITLESLDKVFKLAKDLQDLLFNVDPFMDRGFQTLKGIDSALAPYKDMYNDMQYNKSLLINNAVPKSKRRRVVKPNPRLDTISGTSSNHL